MEFVWIAGRQCMVMALLMLIGYFLRRGKRVGPQGMSDLGSILLYGILPCAVVKSFLLERTPQRTQALLICFGAALCCNLLSMLLARVLYGKRHPAECFSASFSNAGFMGMPLAQAVVGGEAVFFIAPYMALVSVLQWTYGMPLLSNGIQKTRFRDVALNPVVLSLAAGLLLYFFAVPVPGVITQTLELMGNMCAPVAMLLLGAYLTQIQSKELLTDSTAYLCSLVRLLVIPLVTFALLSLLPASLRTIKITLMIAASTPVGTNIVVFARRSGADASRPVKEVCISTVLSLLTIPLMVGLVNYFW